jgi:hypothetical protein
VKRKPDDAPPDSSEQFAITYLEASGRTAQDAVEQLRMMLLAPEWDGWRIRGNVLTTKGVVMWTARGMVARYLDPSLEWKFDEPDDDDD